MNKLLSCIILVVLLVICSCTPSAIYSPSVNLPPDPLRQKELHLMFGYGYMPEARTNRMEEDVAQAAEGTFRVGATDWLWLQLKGWVELSGDSYDTRSGYSFSPTFTVKRDFHGFDFGLMPTGVLLLAGQHAQGGGFTLSGCVWMPEASVFHPYSAIGAGYGIRDDEGVGDKWGWIATVNFGVAVLLAEHLTLNFEVSAIHQYNHYDDQTDRIMVPTINIGFFH